MDRAKSNFRSPAFSSAQPLPTIWIGQSDFTGYFGWSYKESLGREIQSRWKAGRDSRTLLYDALDHTFLRAFEASPDGINDLDWSADSQYLASAHDDYLVRVWDVETGVLYRCFQGHTSYVFCLRYNPQGTVLVSGGFDETLAIWDIKNGREAKLINGAHDDPISSVAFSHDGSRIASCSYDKQIRLWDASSFQCVKTILHISPLSSLQFTPNDNFLLCCSLDSSICLMSCSSGKTVKTYTGHLNARWSITPSFMCDEAFTPTHIICGSEDGKVWIWDVQTRQPTISWQAHVDAVISVHTHGGRLVSASLEKDQTAKLYGIEI